MSSTVRAIWIVLFACSLSIGSVSAWGERQQSGLTYEQFMQLSVEKRRDRFASLTADDRAALKQTHARRWLEANRASLTQPQIELVMDAISFLSASRYRNPKDGEARKHEDELQRRLTCALGRARVTAAFTFLEPTSQRSWIDSADEWLAWFPDCVMGADPDVHSQ
jgi:hypothetical protein